MNEEVLGRQIVALAPTLYRVSCGLLRSEAVREDAVQAAIEKAWKKAHVLRDEGKLKPWLIRILINECYAILRRSGREIPVESLPARKETAPGPQTAFEVRDAVLALPRELRLPIVPHYMEGFSIKEIAAALRCPMGTILSRMSRGRRQLKEWLGDE